VMTLNLALAIMAGFEEDLRDRILGFSPQITLVSHAGPFRDWAKLVEEVRGTPGVTAAAPFVYSQVLTTTPQAVAGAVVRGVIPEDLDAVIEVGKHIREGSAGNLGKPMTVRSLLDGKEIEVQANGILVGREMAKNLNVGVGDSVNVMSPMGTPSAVGVVPRVKRFAVAGVFDSGMYEYDSTLMFMALPDAQQFLDLGPTVSGIEIKVADLYAARGIADQIEHKAGFPFHARDWMEVNRNLFVAFQLERFLYFSVLLLIVLVAAFNIVATLIMVVMEKRKDIAILKSMGATNLAVGWIFVFKGAMIGTVGTLLGVVLGWIGASLVARYPIDLPKDVFYVATVPVRIYPMNFVTTGLAAFVICILATIYPARQAARLTPVEVIRYE
jgi:lipoprotein-releasing system permease protein